MAQFTAKPLGLLERVYRFVGGQRGLSEFDLSTQIQPVHDVAPSAERLAVRERFTNAPLVALQSTEVHGAPGTQYGSLAITPATVGGFTGINVQELEQNFDLYVRRCAVDVGATVPNALIQAITFPPAVAGMAAPATVGIYAAFTSYFVAIGVGLPDNTTRQIPLNFRVPWGSTWLTRSTSTVAGTVVQTVFFELVLKGAAPPTP